MNRAGLTTPTPFLDGDNKIISELPKVYSIFLKA